MDARTFLINLSSCFLKNSRGQTLSTSGYHIFWGIYDASGNAIALRDYAAATVQAWDSKLDAADNLLVAGYSYTTNLKTLYKLDLTGNLIWTWEAGAGPGGMNAMTLDNTGAIYMTGEFSGPADFNGTIYTPTPGTGGDAFVLKINPSGTL